MRVPQKQWIFYLVGILPIVILLLLGVTHWYRQQQEGFAASLGQVPFADQASYIPTDVAGATTVDPTLAAPEMRDYVDALDSLRYFLKVYLPETAAAAGVSPDEGERMLVESAAALATIKTYIEDPDLVRSRDVLETAAAARRMADRVRRVSIPASRYWGPDVLSVCY